MICLRVASGLLADVFDCIGRIRNVVRTFPVRESRCNEHHQDRDHADNDEELHKRERVARVHAAIAKCKVESRRPRTGKWRAECGNAAAGKHLRIIN